MNSTPKAFRIRERTFRLKERAIYNIALQHLDSIAYVGTFIGLVSLVVSGITGFLDIGGFTMVHVYARAPYLAFKISWVIIAMEIYAAMLYIRWRTGDTLWKWRGYRTMYVLLALLGAGIITMVSSYGGKMIYEISSLDWAWNFLKGLGVPLP
ncbi:MAG: hypothetical protein ACE5GD_08085 [Candidatus Geothermarchaeales archaeon]